MHTLACNAHHNERLIRFFIQKAYPGGLPTVEDLIRDNIINGTQLSELAVSKTSGIQIHAVGYGQDLIDGSDVKTSTVQHCINRKKRKDGSIYECNRHQINIRDVDNKIGTLRCIVYNPFFDRWHFFLVPKNIRGTIKHLKIAFDKRTGDPTGKYAIYQVPSWEDVCVVENIFV